MAVFAGQFRVGDRLRARRRGTVQPRAVLRAWRACADFSVSCDRIPDQPRVEPAGVDQQYRIQGVGILYVLPADRDPAGGGACGGASGAVHPDPGERRRRAVLLQGEKGVRDGRITDSLSIYLKSHVEL